MACAFLGACVYSFVATRAGAACFDFKDLFVAMLLTGQRCLCAWPGPMHMVLVHFEASGRPPGRVCACETCTVTAWPQPMATGKPGCLMLRQLVTSQALVFSTTACQLATESHHLGCCALFTSAVWRLACWATFVAAVEGVCSKQLAPAFQCTSLSGCLYGHHSC